ncbi:MAG: helical backbone metal receptor [Ginsengibacter sp.]
MPSFTDQTGYIVEVKKLPERIVSLVPSQTELLYDLGMGEKVKGITKFCVHPEAWFKNKKRIGGTKTIKIDLVDKIRPDLIIANKEENIQEQAELLRKKYPVWTSDISTLQDALTMISAIGIITNTAAAADRLIKKINYNFSRFYQNEGFQSVLDKKLRTAYLIWKDPYMAAGKNTFIDAMMQQCGLLNIYADTLRYPVIDIEQLKSCGCDLLLLSSEPYPFSQKHILEFKQMLPDIKILLVDGEMFSWYGSRLLLVSAYFTSLLLQIDTIYR